MQSHQWYCVSIVSMGFDEDIDNEGHREKKVDHDAWAHMACGKVVKHIFAACPHKPTLLIDALPTMAWQFQRQEESSIPYESTSRILLWLYSQSCKSCQSTQKPQKAPASTSARY